MASQRTCATLMLATMLLGTSSLHITSPEGMSEERAEVRKFVQAITDWYPSKRELTTSLTFPVAADGAIPFPSMADVNKDKMISDVEYKMLMMRIPTGNLYGEDEDEQQFFNKCWLDGEECFSDHYDAFLGPRAKARLLFPKIEASLYGGGYSGFTNPNDMQVKHSPIVRQYLEKFKSELGSVKDDKTKAATTWKQVESLLPMIEMYLRGFAPPAFQQKGKVPQFIINTLKGTDGDMLLPLNGVLAAGGMTQEMFDFADQDHSGKLSHNEFFGFLLAAMDISASAEKVLPEKHSPYEIFNGPSKYKMLSFHIMNVYHLYHDPEDNVLMPSKDAYLVPNDSFKWESWGNYHEGVPCQIAQYVLGNMTCDQSEDEKVKKKFIHHLEEQAKFKQ